jgi:hypothetical protein
MFLNTTATHDSSFSTMTSATAPRFQVTAKNAALFVRFERLRARLVHIDTSLLPHWRAQSAALRIPTAALLFVGRVFVEPTPQEATHAQAQVEALSAERDALVNELAALEDALLRNVVVQEAFTTT